MRAEGNWQRRTPPTPPNLPRDFPTVASPSTRKRTRVVVVVAPCQPDSYSPFAFDAVQVVPCSKRFVHDWTECPFAHPQEKARRRDPASFNYTGIACPSMKKEGTCAFGDHCPYAHNVFEYWLHPTRYRTQLCNDGMSCQRKICFFAHSLDELRVPACKPFVSPEALATAAGAAATESDVRRRSGVVGSPIANLDIGTTRSSMDSVRQSSEWGPAPMPNVQSSPQNESPAALPASQPAENKEDEPRAMAQLTQQDQQVIEAVTSMLAQERLTPAQAAGILQQMLPASSLQLLQLKLGGVNPMEGPEMRRALSDPLGNRQMKAEAGGMNTSIEQLAAIQAIQNSTSYPGAMQNERQSFESSRSSFDTARMSFENARGSFDFVSPRGSMDQSPQSYLPPAPAFPQYWTGQQLMTVPEGLPMINTPTPRGPWSTQKTTRHSTGNLDSAATRLTSDFNRMSFDGQDNTTINPYASAFFMSSANADTGLNAATSTTGGQESQKYLEEISVPGNRRSENQMWW